MSGGQTGRVKGLLGWEEQREEGRKEGKKGGREGGREQLDGFSREMDNASEEGRLRKDDMLGRGGKRREEERDL